MTNNDVLSSLYADRELLRRGVPCACPGLQVLTAPLVVLRPEVSLACLSYSSSLDEDIIQEVCQL